MRGGCGDRLLNALGGKVVLGLAHPAAPKGVPALPGCPMSRYMALFSGLWTPELLGCSGAGS